MKTLHSRDVQPAQLRGVNPETRTVDIKASDDSLDSYATRIDQGGWDLEQFKVNGPICLQHDSYRSLPVATAIGPTVRVENGELLMRVQFPPKGTTVDADEAFGLIQAGILKGVSVGFMPTAWDDTEEEVDGAKRTVRVYRKQKLLEVSFVTIPANDNGLVSRSREVNADPEAMKKLTESLESRMTPDTDEAEAKDEIGQFRATHLLKCVRYYENKQPANKESTKVLKAFFERVLKEEPPAAEADAWKRMGEAVGALEETGEEPDPEAATGETPTEVTEETKPEETTPPEAALPEPTPAEAPQPEQKASVSIPLDALKALPAAFKERAEAAAAKASRAGTPAHRIWDAVEKDLGTLISTLSHPS